MKYKLGLLPSPPDIRDYKFEVLMVAPPVEVPEECTTWLAWQTPVKYQGEFGACAAFAGTAMKETFDTKEYNAPLDLSEQFLYGEAKKIDGFPEEEGTNFRAILSVLKHLGISEENLCPYEGKYPPSVAPATNVYENALKYKINSYAAVIPTKDAIKRAIFQNGPVAIGINAYENFENAGADGIIGPPTGKLVGGHGLIAVAYNATGLICKNSWSTYWGNQGYCTIPWDVYEKICLGEAWTLVDIVGGVVTTPYTNWFIELLRKLFSIFS